MTALIQTIRRIRQDKLAQLHRDQIAYTFLAFGITYHVWKATLIFQALAGNPCALFFCN